MCASRTPNASRAASSARCRRSGPTGSSLATIELLEDVEQHQCREPLPVRRQLDHIEAAIIRRDRGDDIATMLRKVVRSEQPALLLNRGRNVVRNGPLVECLGAAAHDRLQRRGQRGQTHDAADRRRRAVWQVVFRGARMWLELGGVVDPVGANARRDDVAVLGVADRRLQCAAEAEAAMFLQDRFPGINCARHRDGMRRGGGNLPAHACGQHLLGRGCSRGAAGAIVAPHRLIGLRYQAETVAADAGHRRLDHAQHRDRRDCGIGCGATGFQRFDCREASERVRGRSHPLARVNGRAAGQVEIACFHSSGKSNVAGHQR